MGLKPELTRLSLFAGKNAFFLRFLLKGLPHIFLDLRVAGVVVPEASGYAHLRHTWQLPNIDLSKSC